MNTTTAPTIRWLIKRDLPDVLKIDRMMFPEPWGREGIMGVLRTKNHIGNVAAFRTSDGDKVVGFMVYGLQKTKLEIVRMAVDPQHRRTGVGRAMLDKLRGKLNLQRRTHITLDVPEENLAAQLWLRSCGATCIEVMPSAACEGDLYRFVMGVK